MTKGFHRIVFFSWIFLLTAYGIGFSAEPKPDWVDGASSRYPDDSFITGVGSGDRRQGAENSAYTALARVFQSQVRSVTTDHENFRQTDRPSKVDFDRTVEIQNQTEVSTDKLLEQVRIAERWVDPVSQVHYALAVLDRSKAAASLRQRSLAAEMEAKEWEEKAKKSSDTLEQARAFRKAILAARLVEGYAADLRVIQARGIDVPVVNAALLQEQLDGLLRKHFQVAVQVTGPNASSVRAAILERLHRAGFTSGAEEALLITGEVRLEEADRKDPQWRYVRWSGQFTLARKTPHTLFGSINRSGREGQLSLGEAERKAQLAMQEEIADAIGTSLLEFIYGK